MLFDAGKAVVEPLEAIREPRVIEAQAVQDRGVEVVDRDRIARDVVAEVVCFADRETASDAPASQPDSEAAGMMVAAIVVGFELLNDQCCFVEPQICVELFREGGSGKIRLSRD